MSRYLSLLFFLAFTIPSGFAQFVEPEEDVTASSLIAQGKSHLESRQYYQALEVFEAAALRPFNQSTTAAIYLSGLTCFRLADFRRAGEYFAAIVETYPESRYLDESSYHIALILLREKNDRKNRAAVEGLLDIADRTYDKNLSGDAIDRVRNFLFYEASQSFVENLFETGPGSHRMIFLEALCYHLIEAGQREEARIKYENYQMRFGESESLFLKRLFGEEEVVKFIDPDVIRLAMFMPLFLGDYDLYSLDKLPAKSQLATEFYEGFQTALREAELQGNKKIYLKVFDTRRDTVVTRSQMEELSLLQPDIIIGDVFNNPSKIIGEWAEIHRTPQLIPLSPSDELVEEKTQVFLAHPSAETHGRSLAHFAWDSLRLNRVAVWSDLQKSTEILAQSFSQTFDTLGGEIIRLEVDSFLSNNAEKNIYSLVRSLKFQQVDGVYIPIMGNQEVAGLILSQISALGLSVKIMGSPHWWQKYENIDRELKESSELIFTTSYMEDKQEREYQRFYESYLKEYQMPPSAFSVQGYDLGMYLVALFDQYDYRSGESLAGFIRRFPVYHGLHIDIDFQEKQSNQFVNIAAFREGTVQKVNETDEFHFQAKD
ncbi:MAG: ABC transporter substrate-binding protein [Bacteroidia bacterium]|nr:ABC transporter substrate-binding protein [Bacteroidia bacterium]